MNKNFKRNDIQVSLYPDAFLHNVKALRDCCKADVKFCAVVKANAYGHGIREVVNILRGTDVDFFGVVSFYEAIHVADMVDEQQILIFEPLHTGHNKEILLRCAQSGLHCTLTSIEAAKYVKSALKGSSAKLKVHINVDTGMGRCGVGASEAEKLVDFVHSCQTMQLAGIYTHFATADNTDLSFAKEQISCFQRILRNLHKYITKDVIIHAANSPATIKLPESHFDMVRCGISMYGYSTIEKPLPIELKPALKLEVPIVHISTIEKSRSVSYNRTFTAKRTTKIAVLPIGYSDGLWRFFSNKVKLVVNNKPASVIGDITMNQTVIDVTEIPNVRLGQAVTVIDNKFDSPCGVYSLAQTSGTICYEILTNIPVCASVTIAK